MLVIRKEQMAVLTNVAHQGFRGTRGMAIPHEPKVDPESRLDDIADLMESLDVSTVDAEVPGFREKLGW